MKFNNFLLTVFCPILVSFLSHAEEAKPRSLSNIGTLQINGLYLSAPTFRYSVTDSGWYQDGNSNRHTNIFNIDYSGNIVPDQKNVLSITSMIGVDANKKCQEFTQSEYDRHADSLKEYELITTHQEIIKSTVQVNENLLQASFICMLRIEVLKAHGSK